jgi:hypothetical protein
VSFFKLGQVRACYGMLGEVSRVEGRLGFLVQFRPVQDRLGQVRTR